MPNITRSIMRLLRRLFPRPVYNYPPMPQGWAVLHLVNCGWRMWR